MSGLCRSFGVSKQAYYQYNDDYFARLAIETLIIEYVQEQRASAPGLGGEKLWLMFNKASGLKQQIGRDAFLHILGRNKLLLRKRKKTCRTTDSNHDLPVYPDLVNKLLVERPEQVVVSDITYIPTDEGFAFLSLVTDAYTRQILGWYLAPCLTTEYTLKALLMAIKGLKSKDINLIHHSDRGCQYASRMYTSCLKQHGISISMTESGNPQDNAIAERVNGILKTEFLNYHHFENRAQALIKVEEAIAFYNTKRLHRSLNMMTPEEAAQMKGSIKKLWAGSKDPYRTPENSIKPI